MKGPTVFNAAAGIVEKHMPALIKRFQQARLFYFPGRPQDVLPKEFPAEERAFLQEHFFLPFPTIAIEDTVSCTVMWDMEKDQKGLQGRRGFIEIQPFTAQSILDCADADDVDPEEIKAQCARYPVGTVAVAEGYFGPVDLADKTKILFEGAIQWIAVATKKKGIMAVDTLKNVGKKNYDLLSAPILRNVDTSLQEIFYFNSPSRFILQETPLHVRRQYIAGTKHPKDRIPRIHQRPRYTLLKPREIRNRLGLAPVAGGGPKTPHERRRHYRTYPDDPAQWPKVHGRVITVKACWVGPSSATVGRTHYEIRLDL